MRLHSKNINSLLEILKTNLQIYVLNYSYK